MATHHSSGGSFSAVSKPILTTKYSFSSIFRDLQDYLAEFSKFCWFSRYFAQYLQIFRIFAKICESFSKFVIFRCKVYWILPELLEIADTYRIFFFFARKLQKFAKKKMQKIQKNPIRSDSIRRDRIGSLGSFPSDRGSRVGLGVSAKLGQGRIRLGQEVRTVQ